MNRTMTASEAVQWDAFISQLEAAHRDSVKAFAKAGVTFYSHRSNGIDAIGPDAKEITQRAAAWFTKWSAKNDAGRLQAWAENDGYGGWSVRLGTRGSRAADVSSIRRKARRVAA